MRKINIKLTRKIIYIWIITFLLLTSSSLFFLNISKAEEILMLESESINGEDPLRQDGNDDYELTQTPPPRGDDDDDDCNSPPEPQTPEGPTTGYTNTEYQFNFTATDPDNDLISYTIIWGDETTDGPLGPYNSGETITQQHSWNITGRYSIQLYAEDEEGFAEFSLPLAITIKDNRDDNNPSNTPPIAKTPEGPTTGYTNTEYQFNFTATDPDNDLISYTIIWGDETTDGPLGPYNSGETITQQHSWNTQGTYSIVLLAEDEHGAINESDQLTIEVITYYTIGEGNTDYSPPIGDDDDDDDKNTNYNNNKKDNSNNNQEEQDKENTNEEKNEQEPTALSYYQENQGTTNNGKYNLPSIIGTLTNIKNPEISWTIIITAIITITTILIIYLIKTKNIYLTNRI